MSVLAVTPVFDPRPLRSGGGYSRALRRTTTLAAAVLGLFAGAIGRGAETVPPAPKQHFNDYAGLVRPQTASALNQELARHERETSNQIVVALFPKLPSASSVDDFTVRTAQAWRVGQRDRRNGAVLFVFQESRDIRIEVGYGLEGVLPDARCKQIIENEIIPRFRAGDFDGGVSAGVRAMIASVKGEYRGTGRTVADARGGTSGGRGGSFVGFFFLLLMLIIFGRARRHRGMLYRPRGRRGIWLGPPFGGGGFGGGGFGGGGTFSGGGGSFGGGGAGGRW